uniref:Uncharacterized protein n=1 Tax=Arundo donax TaxID=35708 RepID=A0A0A8ZVK5_ARUDO
MAPGGEGCRIVDDARLWAVTVRTPPVRSRGVQGIVDGQLGATLLGGHAGQRGHGLRQACWR